MKRRQVTDRIVSTAPGEWALRAAQAVEIIKWQLRGCPFRTPHAYKQRIVREYAARYGLQVFVETGTQYGKMLIGVQRHFKTLYSIELHPELAALARSRFARFPHIHVLEGDSALEIHRVLERLDEDALFWLDAHFFPYGPSGRGRELTPLRDELEAILARKERRFVLLVDDAHCFVPERGYPALEEVREQVRQLRPELNWTVEHDIIRITP